MPDNLIAEVSTVKVQESWLQDNWRTIAALVYLFICLMDFVIMPFLTFMWHVPLTTILKEIVGLTPDIQKEVLERSIVFWTPITIAGDGIIHIAFGGLLGISAWGKSNERVEQVKQEATTQRAILANRQPNIIQDRQ